MSRVAIHFPFIAALQVLLIGCTVDRSSLDERLYRCETNEHCGDGMICYHGLEPLLARDQAYCLPDCSSCDGFCDSDGACHQICDPNAPDCPAGMNCLRSLFDGAPIFDGSSPMGVCAGLATCEDSFDCTDAIRSVCLSDLAVGLPGLGDAGGLYCIQTDCRSGGSCEPGWSCLADLLDGEDEVDLCLPNCTTGSCPQGLECVPIGDEYICVPGWYLGGLCDDDLNCLVGQCLSSSVFDEFQYCMAPCVRDSDCESIPTETEARCSYAAPETPACWQAELGLLCATDVDCAPFGLTCHTVDVRYGTFDISYEICTTLCTEDDECAEFDGFCAHDEIYGGDVCHPIGRLGATCSSPAQCAQWLDGCHEVTYRETPYDVCTSPCETDMDCEIEGGFCANIPGVVDGEVCYPPIAMGGQCLPEREATMCREGLSCLGYELNANGTTAVEMVCSTMCNSDEDCVSSGLSELFCANEPGLAEPVARDLNGICVPALYPGAECTRDSMCVRGFCNDAGLCVYVG